MPRYFIDKKDCLIHECCPIKSTCSGEQVPLACPFRLQQYGCPPISALALISRFLKAMIKWVRSGFKIVSTNQYDQRTDICWLCSVGSRCPLCGCFKRLKCLLKSERCPAKLWKE